MSRCKCCGFHFDEENGWQDYCSLKCAQKHIGRKAWEKWIAEPKNIRTVRMGEQAQAPKIGRIVRYKIDYRTIDYNIGGIIEVRPLTDLDRANILRYRGMGFSDGNQYNVWRDELPSVCAEKCGNFAPAYGGFDYESM